MPKVYRACTKNNILNIEKKQFVLHITDKKAWDKTEK